MAKLYPSREFQSLVDRILPLYHQLLNAKPAQKRGFPRKPRISGVYLFTDPSNGKHLYVGRTNRIRERWTEHSTNNHNQAPFALKIAREATNIERDYKGVKKQFENFPELKCEFDAARERIREMEFRYVEVDCANEQCLLEFYAAVTLNTPYNDFENT